MEQSTKIPTKKEFCELLGTYCAMYNCVPYYYDKMSPLPVNPNQIFSGLQYDDLVVGQIVNMHVYGNNMKWKSLYGVELKERFENSEIIRIAKCGDMKAVLFSPQYLDHARMTCNIDFGEEYRRALESPNLAKIRTIQSLILKSAEEQNKLFQNDTKKLAKELGLAEAASDKRFKNALASAANALNDKYSYQLWEGEPAHFMISCESYDQFVHELYDLTYANLQLMQEQEQEQSIQRDSSAHDTKPAHNSLDQLVQQASGDDWMQIDHGDDIHIERQ